MQQIHTAQLMQHMHSQLPLAQHAQHRQRQNQPQHQISLAHLSLQPSGATIPPPMGSYGSKSHEDHLQGTHNAAIAASPAQVGPCFFQAKPICSCAMSQTHLFAAHKCYA